jgi:signal transduction histidine kinase
MKLRTRLVLTLLAVSVLPLLLANRYAFSFFHHFSKHAQEKAMEQSGRLAGHLFRLVPDPAARADVLDAHARDTASRIRVFDAQRRLVYDSGVTDLLDLKEDREIQRAFDTGRYAARWALSPDRKNVHYFSAVPWSDAQGGVIGVAQVIRDTGDITRALSRMKAQQEMAARSAAGISICLALLSAWALTRRLRRLRRAAATFAQTGSSTGFDLAGRDEVAELAAGFRDMATELEKRQHYNRDFVLTTLHELKTPLTAIRGAAELLQSRPDMRSEDRERFVGNIVVQSQRLGPMVEALRSLTSLDLDLPGEVLEIHPAGALLSAALERLRPGLRGPVELLGGDCPALLRVQPGRIEQALGNVLDNALRHQPEGRGPVRLLLRTENDLVVIAVEDDGPGIAEENLERVFDRFFTTVPRGQSLDYGLGLGLAEVKRILEHHRGEVFARNRPEGGAAVGFVLPVA